VRPARQHLARELRDVVGVEHLLTDDEVTQRYRTDWTGRFHAPDAVVVRPGSTDEIAALVRVCLAHDTAIVAQGGNTGLVGGGVPLAGGIVLSTERLHGVEEVDARVGELSAGPGTRLGEVRRVASEQGWQYAVDLASRDSATLGGTIATNAVGIRAIRHGDTRRQVLGVEVVTGTGAVVSSMSGTARDNTGYHLPSIVTGSEGTLGVVTRARVRLVPRPRVRTTVLIRFADARDAVRSAEAMRGFVPPVDAVELFFADGLALVCEAFALPPPFTELGGGYVLAELAGNDEHAAALGEMLDSLEGVSDVAVAEDSNSRERLWRYRELHTEAISTIGVPHKLDVAVPPGALPHFVAEVRRVVAEVAPSARTWLFGHGGDSTVHVNVTGTPEDDLGVDEAVLRLVSAVHGSISAEHGIGRAKLPWIGLAHTDAELAVMAGVKAAFDPFGIMNPGVLLPRTLR
jgi:FAD/FMN-containing dehydrogenase